MKYLLKEAVLINRLPEAISAIAYSPAVPAIPATETSPAVPEIPEVPAQPKKYKFFATIFIKPENAPDGEFVQDKNIMFLMTGEKTIAEVEAQLLIEAQNYININYPEIL